MADVVRKITANIPAKLLAQAQATTGLGITATLVAGLEELEHSRKRVALRLLPGKVRFYVDLSKTGNDSALPNYVLGLTVSRGFHCDGSERTWAGGRVARAYRFTAGMCRAGCRCVWSASGE
jgi:hypothetical protein